MPISYKYKGKWVTRESFIYKNKKWYNLLNRYHKVDTTWNPVYKYNWSISNWTACSAACDGGIQTRVVNCMRNGSIVEDRYCVGAEQGAVPIRQQTCNTQMCWFPINITVSWDDNFALYLWRRSDNGITTLYKTGGGKHGGYAWGAYGNTFNYSLASNEFPLRVIVSGINVSHGGGPRHLRSYGANSQSSNGCGSPCFVFLQVEKNGTLSKIDGHDFLYWRSCPGGAQVGTYTATNPWTNNGTIVNCFQ